MFLLSIVANLPKNNYDATILFNTIIDKPKCILYDAIIQDLIEMR